MNIMGVPPAEYLSLPIRAHSLLQGVPLYDVSSIDLPGGGDGRTVGDIRALRSAASRSAISMGLFGLRHFIGKLFGWDRKRLRPEDSYASRLSERERSESEVTPGTPDGAFLIVYQYPNEMLSETQNATVHGFIGITLTREGTGYRLYMAIYVIPTSWITRPYLLAIEPFRRILYPSLLKRIRRAWVTAYR